MKPGLDKLLWLLAALPALPLAAGWLLDQTAIYPGTTQNESAPYHWLQASRMDFAPVNNETYLAECGSCHFAFQPGLLPQRSWQQLMQNLDSHFGDSAELNTEMQQSISQYLRLNSADNSPYLRARNLSQSLKPEETPIRITDTLYFKRKHHVIPAQQLKANPAIGSFSNCNNCHRHAAQGLYNEHDVLIPNTTPTIANM